MDKIWFVVLACEQYSDIEEVDNNTSYCDVVPIGAYKEFDSAVEGVKSIIGNDCYYEYTYSPNKRAMIELCPEEEDEIKWCNELLETHYIEDRKLGNMEIRFSINKFEVQ